MDPAQLLRSFVSRTGSLTLKGPNPPPIPPSWSGSTTQRPLTSINGDLIPSGGASHLDDG